MVDNADLYWRGNDLCRNRSTRALVSIVPDSKYPGMWRVLCDGRLSDIANRTRAREAARAAALAISKRRETPLEAAKESFSGASVPGQPPWSENGSA
jgi:hypothetical protein